MSEQDQTSSSSEQETPEAAVTPLAPLDTWARRHTLHTRILPMFAYLLLLALTSLAREAWPLSYPFLYVLQCGITLYLVWRYRKYLDELTLSFHWLAVPVGLAALAGWILLGIAMARLVPGWFGGEGTNFFQEMGTAFGWTSMVLRLLGMSIVVPIIEELFFRSMMQRAFIRPVPVWCTFVRALEDMPLIGDRVMRAGWARRVHRNHPTESVNASFLSTPLGTLSVFSVVMVSLVWCLAHAPRDYPGTIFCGVVYALLVWATNRRAGLSKGLGPVIWAHGITNAGLWVYTLVSNDWRFL